MIKLIAGGKGEGKTKKLIEMANTAIKSSDGHIVFIDDDRRHIYDLHYDIRFVETLAFPLSNYREFIGFVYGILSQDSDIVEIYVDGLTNVIRTIDDEALLKLKMKLEKLSESHNVNFVMSINSAPSDLPEEMQRLIAQ